LTDVTYPTFLHKGIIINVEDFLGRIEIVNSKFIKNMHYIPGILYRSDSKSTLAVSAFTDTSVTQELQLQNCDPGS
jgi:hypothetical protein